MAYSPIDQGRLLKHPVRRRGSRGHVTPPRRKSRSRGCCGTRTSWPSRKAPTRSRAPESSGTDIHLTREELIELDRRFPPAAEDKSPSRCCELSVREVPVHEGTGASPGKPRHDAAKRLSGLDIRRQATKRLTRVRRGISVCVAAAPPQPCLQLPARARERRLTTGVRRCPSSQIRSGTSFPVRPRPQSWSSFATSCVRRTCTIPRSRRSKAPPRRRPGRCGMPAPAMAPTTT